MKKYIISEEALQSLYLSSRAINRWSFHEFLVNCGNSIQKYKEPEQEPKFREGDVVYYVDGVGVKRAEFVNNIYDHDFVGAALKNSIGRRYEVGIKRLFKTPNEAFDFLEREK